MFPNNYDGYLMIIVIMRELLEMFLTQDWERDIAKVFLVVKIKFNTNCCEKATGSEETKSMIRFKKKF